MNFCYMLHTTRCMSNVLVSIYSWENPRVCEAGSFEVEKNSKVIVSLESGNEFGIITEVNIPKADAAVTAVEKIIRLATERDCEIYEKYEKEKNEFLKACHLEVKKQNLPMKIIDARISLDGKQITFVFTADGRVDFRELVKNISKETKRGVRMQQIGSRDEARKLGGYGICGRELCCVKFPGSIPSITTDMAKVQQIASRGSERISGLCGRLMCCLAYEAEQYRSLLEGMPEMYSVVETKEGRGTVIEINVATQEVKVKVESGKYVILKKTEL